MLEKVKMALRITTNAFDDELQDLIAAACDDLGIAGVWDAVRESPESFPLVARAIVTYCKLNFGEPADPVRLKASYDEQKAQLSTATGYTVWR